jgi:ankyrin repeat protein
MEKITFVFNYFIEGPYPEKPIYLWLTLLFVFSLSSLLALTAAPLTADTAIVLDELGRPIELNKNKTPSPQKIESVAKNVGVNTMEEAQALMDILAWEEENGKLYPSVTVAVMFHRSPEEIEALLQEKADINEDHPLFRTPVYQAIAQGRDPDYLLFLLKKGADPNKPIRFGRGLLYEAVNNGDKDLAELLISYGAEPVLPKNLRNKKDSSVDIAFYDPFYLALKSGDTDMVKPFLAAGASPNIQVLDDSGDSYFPLIVASNSRNVDPELIELLLKAGASPKSKDKDGCTALSIIEFTKENIPAAILLIDAGAPTDDPCIIKNNYRSLYHWAVLDDSEDLFNSLKKAKASPNYRDQDGLSPLYIAVVDSKLWQVKALLDAGAYINKSVTTKSLMKPGYTGVFWERDDLLAVAVRRTDSFPIVKTLLDAGVNVNTQSNQSDEYYPLHFCAELNKPQMAEAILQKKAKTEVRDEYDHTPLHLAVRYDNLLVVQLLMAAGADPKAKEIDGLIPADFAKGKPDEKELLEALKR